MVAGFLLASMVLISLDFVVVFRVGSGEIAAVYGGVTVLSHDLGDLSDQKAAGHPRYTGRGRHSLF